MLQIQSRDSAVSPVIGVMLMLVVCIIIAAVISGFVGGLAGNTSKGPQIALGAKVSYGTSIELIHESGEPIAWENTEFRTFIPRGEFKGTSYLVPLDNGYVYKTDGTPIPIFDGASSYAPLFRPGATAFFEWQYCFATGSGGPMVPANGEQLVLQLFDKVSGNMIGEKTVTVV